MSAIEGNLNAESVRYEKAWRVEASRDGEYGVVVQCGSDRYPYWWLLCPAAATLYTEELPDMTDCNLGMECDWDDVHKAATALVRALLNDGLDDVGKLEP